MRLRPVRHAVAAASAALLVTSCSAGKDTSPHSDAPSSPAAAAPAPKPLNEEQLTAVTLTPQDLPGHKVEAAFQGPLISTDRPECRDLATALLGGAMTGTGGQVHTQATKGTTTTKVSLHSWYGTKAATLLADIKGAGRTCTGAINVVTGDEKVTLTNIVPGAALAAGDENASFSAEQDLSGAKTPIEVALVRKGTTLVTFTARSTSATAEKPAEVVAAQLKKLN
ncbi:hypothetical protein QEZ40_005357 [Streptomyces katrae]|uniref:Lipoprotein n=1 Tax=Streptomyces katrae TaxID=68223 RepID=A0ABT7GNS3_9ACTN|nr:hypothetical protein [Streptomyces katrae]MDK9495227.1 hypothetical protein [Streptomyces katrae]